MKRHDPTRYRILERRERLALAAAALTASGSLACARPGDTPGATTLQASAGGRPVGCGQAPHPHGPAPGVQCVAPGRL